MPFPQAVLRNKFTGVPIHDNIKTLTRQKLIDYGWNPNQPTVLTGGFPCQPFSVAGKRKGTDDDRYLWPEMLRVIQEAQPAWVVGENVGGFSTMELDTGIAEVADQEGAIVLFKKVAQQVIDDLNSIGYDVPRTDQGDPVLFIIPACAINAPHRIDRIWIVAHRNDDGQLAAEVGRRLHARDDRGSTRAYQTEQPSRCAVSGEPSAQDPNSATDGELQEQGGVWQFGNAGTGGYERNTDRADAGYFPYATGKGLPEPRQTNKREFQKENREGLDDRLEQLRGCDAANASGSRFEKLYSAAQPKEQRQYTRMGTPKFTYWRYFPTEPPLYAGDDGLRAELVRLGCRNPDKVIQYQRQEAIKGAGNAIVPYVALEIFEAIEHVEKSYR